MQLLTYFHAKNHLPTNVDAAYALQKSILKKHYKIRVSHQRTPFLKVVSPSENKMEGKI